jgi:hypothetical protein
MDLFRPKSWKPFMKLQDETGLDLAVRMMFAKVFRGPVRVDAMSAICADQNLVQAINDVGRAS